MTDAALMLDILEQAPGFAWTLDELSAALVGVDSKTVRLMLWVLIDCGVVDITPDRRIVLIKERDR